MKVTIQRSPLLFAAIAALASAGVRAQEMDGNAALTQLQEAAEALGGLEEILAIERLQLYGYGQEADGFGSGNVAGSPHAPQKYGAQNDLQRIWDLENGRYMERQRGNLLFPFAAPFGHDFALSREVLDGDVSYSIGDEEERQRTDDARELKMRSLGSNPVAAVRAALEDDSILSDVHVEDGMSVLDVQLGSGEEFTIGFEWETDLPRFVSWSGPNHYLGEVRYTTRFTGYVPYDGIYLPLGIVTNWDWRDIDFFKIYGEGYVVDGEIPDLAAPEAVRAAEPPQFEPETLEVEEVADGIWRISNGTTVVEFADHLLLFELGGFGYDDETLPIIELARSLVPDKPLTQYIATHHHDDHSSGLRTAVAEGLTVISHRQNEGIYREIASRPAPNFPDRLHRSPRRLEFVPVDGHLRLQDDERTLDVYHVVGHNHMANAVFAHDPIAEVMIESDIAPAEAWQWWADAYEENLERYDLSVRVVSSNHFGVMTHEEMLAFLEPGRVRAQERCVERVRQGEYLPGCPPFFPRGNMTEDLSEEFDPAFE